MSSAITCTRKSFVTDGTFVRFVPRMDTSVNREITPSSETFLANVTCVRFLTAVNMHVFGQILFQCKGERTFAAGERLLSGMGRDVSLEAITLSE